jgi:hypothetical protein
MEIQGFEVFTDIGGLLLNSENIMSKHTKRYTRCDICYKDDLFDKVGFEYNSDWNIQHGFDICDCCTENGGNGEIWHYRDVENMEEVISEKGDPEWDYVKEDREWAFMKADSEGEIRFVKWLTS